MYDTINMISGLLEGVGTVVGAFLIVKQIKLSRESDEKQELIKRKEITLDAYNAISDELRKHNEILKLKFSLHENNKLSEENIMYLNDNPQLLKHLILINDYLGRFAIGVKNNIYDLDVIIEISGRWMIRTFDRYELYIQNIRDTYSPHGYKDTEQFIETMRSKLVKNGETTLIKS